MSIRRTRYVALTVVATLALAACGGGENAAADSTQQTTLPPSAEQPKSASAAPEAPGPAIDVIPGTAAPITGAIIEVKLVGDAKGYRFEPQHITARAGDGVKFVVISGGPHEIAFDLNAVPPASRTQLQVNMPNSADGRSPLLSGVQETWTLSLGALAPGRYPFVSTPRLPQGMKGEIEIR